MKKLFISFIFLFTFAAQANSNTVKHQDLELIKLGCKDPAAVGNQIRPSKIQIVCKDQRLVWEQARTEQRDIPSQRIISTVLRTNKTNLKVAPKTFEAPVSSTAMNCPVMQEIKLEVSINYNVTCDEVLDMNTIEDFCFESLEKDISKNDDIMQRTATGNVIYACAQTRQGRQGRQRSQ
ncbi:MAG: hypothetical protein OEY33_08600, partial [Bdellovibrionales bacterium]|nr:hypothetical protein [Bdellovibrionales bacterium]